MARFVPALASHILKVNDLRGESKNISVTEVHARHILLKPSPIMTDEQARVKLEQIAADIKSGKTTFAAAAKEFSQDPGSANQGGDLGWATPDIFDPAFRDAPDPPEQRSNECTGSLFIRLAFNRTAGYP